MVVRFTESVRVRLWGKSLRYDKGEVHRVSVAVAGVLLAQGCVEPVAHPPVMSQVKRAA